MAKFCKKTLWFFMLTPVVATAAGGEGIPIGFLLAQVLNFSLFVLILVFIFSRVLPSFLRQKQEDFLAYRKKAKEVEQKQSADCLILQQKIQHLTDKQKNLKKAVAKAIHYQEKELAQETKSQLKSLKTREEQSLKHTRLKETSRLRSWLLSQVMAKAKEEINTTDPQQKEATFEIFLKGLKEWKGIK